MVTNASVDIRNSLIKSLQNGNELKFFSGNNSMTQTLPRYACKMRTLLWLATTNGCHGLADACCMNVCSTMHTRIYYHHILTCTRTGGGVAQWLECLSLAGGLSWSMPDRWPLCG